MILRRSEAFGCHAFEEKPREKCVLITTNSGRCRYRTRFAHSRYLGNARLGEFNVIQQFLGPRMGKRGRVRGLVVHLPQRPGSAVCDGKRADPGRANDYELRGIFSTMMGRTPITLASRITVLSHVTITSTGEVSYEQSHRRHRCARANCRYRTWPPQRGNVTCRKMWRASRASGNSMTRSART